MAGTAELLWVEAALDAELQGRCECMDPSTSWSKLRWILLRFVTVFALSEKAKIRLPLMDSGFRHWRRGTELNRRIELLQSSALPLGYRAESRKFGTLQDNFCRRKT